MPTNNLSYPEQPLFSVIVPCYKQAELLSEALDSLVSQEYTFWEAIVVNDGSPDNTNEIANRYADKDQRIRLLIKENGGLSSARNAGMKIAKGKWLLFLDADDLLIPGCLTELSLAQKNADIKTLIHYGYRYIHFSGNKIIHESKPTFINPLIPRILLQNIGPCHSLIIQKEFADTIGFFDESLKSAEDWDFWIRAAKHGATIQSLSEILVSYRVSEQSMSRQPATMYEAVKKVCLRALEKDNRLSDQLPGNRSYPEIDPSSAIKRTLAMCLGVLLVQDQLKAAKNLYENETRSYDLKWSVEDWKQMSSYLSFRYMTQPKEIQFVLQALRPRCFTFLQAIGISSDLQSEIIKSVFEWQLKKQNVMRWGYAGKIINKIEFR